MSSLRKKTVSGFKWVAFSNYAQKGLSVITFIILARLLEPKVFGLFAMAFIVIDGLQLFRNFGLGAALIQRNDNVDEASHTIFWMMPFMGIGVFVLLFFIAPMASLALREESLIPILRTLGLIFVLGSMESVPKVLLSKALKFKELAIRELFSSILYSGSAVIFALNNMGVWSLVYAYILRRTSMLLLAWKLVDYRPKFVFSRKIAFELLHFGKFVLGSSATLFLIKNVDKFILGRILGAATLGYYALAYNIATITTTHLSSLMHRVLFPAFSRIQDDKNAVKNQSLKIMKMLSIFSVPFGIIVILLSSQIVELVYGAKWLPMVPSLRILSLISIFLPLMSLSGPIFIACGKPQWQFLTRLITISSMVIGIPIGVSVAGLFGGAIAVTGSNLVIIPVVLILFKRLINIRAVDIAALLRPSFLSGFIMAIVIYILKLLLPSYLAGVSLNGYILLGFLICGGGSYLITFYLLDKDIFYELKRYLINK